MAQTWIGRPLAIGNYDAWTLGAGATKPIAVDPGDPVVHDDDTTYISKANGAAASQQSFTLLPYRPLVASIVSFSYGLRSKIAWAISAESLTVFARLNGVDGATSLATHGVSNAWTTFGAALARPGGGNWTVPDLLNPTLEICVGNPASVDGAVRVSSLWVSVSYEPVPAQNSKARDVGSRRLLAFRRESSRLTPIIRAEFLDAELLDEIGVAHYAHPLHNALGGGLQPWQRVPHRVMRSEFNLQAMTLGVELKDIRGQLLQLWDVGRSMKTSGPTLDGIARLDPGCTRTLTRASNAWVPSPSDGLVHQCRDGEEKIETNGMLFEQARTNGLTRSSFVSQLTGWTTTTGVTADQAEPTIFEAGVSGYVAKIASNIVDRGPTSPASSSYSANARISVSIDYREAEADTALKVRITRGVDGNFWNGSTWQAGGFSLAVTASMVDARAKFEDIDVGGNATTITVRPILINGAAGKTAYIKHVQVELGRWATSRIVTDAATVTRAIDSLKISNNSGRRCWNKDRGTVMFRYRRAWGANAGSTTFYLFDLTYDASNWFRVYYSWTGGGAGTELRFEARVAGNTYTASKAFTAAAATTYRLAVRWTSSSAELGLAAFTISVFVDGVKGTDAVASAMPTETSPVDLYVGGDSGATLSADGNVFDIVHTQQVLTDAEISRGF